MGLSCTHRQGDTINTCIDCGQAFEPNVGRGRPRKRCTSCAPRSARTTPRHTAGEAQCAHCHKDFDQRHGAQRYCSVTCREKSKWQRMPRVPCRSCGNPTGYKVGTVETALCQACPTAHGTTARYKRGCRCQQCREAATAAHRSYLARRAANADMQRPCTETGCTGDATVRGRCQKHHRAHLRATGQWKPSPADHWANPNRLARSKRRQYLQRSGATVGELFTVNDLLERDNHTCGICDRHIPTEAKWPEPLSPTIDHIVPLSKGGEHSMANTRAAHARCNIRRGATQGERIFEPSR